MKKWFLFLLLFISPIVLGAPCDGVQGRSHKNPDGTPGGFVATTAKVAPTVFVDVSSAVCEQAQVQGNVKISNDSVIAGKALVEGVSLIVSSVIKGEAKVFGRASIFNSAVCQQSEVNFKVSDSNFYCSIYEPEPKDPGELGKRTAVGIDGNVNGLRDDVEIWINNVTTNSPTKDLTKTRDYLYAAAKELQKAIVHKNDEKRAKQSYLNAVREMSCVSKSKDKAIAVLPNKLNVVAFNTKDRLDAWLVINSRMKGIKSSDLNSSCE